jgi:hypothetical protein
MLAGSIDLTAKVTGTLPIANGGTGSTTKNFVDLTTSQSIAGNKNFTGTTTLGDLNVRGDMSTRYLQVMDHASIISDLDVGGRASISDLDVGGRASISDLNVTNLTTPLIIGGTAVGSNLIYKSTTGTGTTTGIAHQFVGGTNGATVAQTILNNGNVGIGTTAPAEKLDIAGNVKFSGALMPNNIAGTSGQVLTSAGVGAVPTWATAAVTVTEVDDEFTATASQTAFTLTQTPSANSKVKMYVNGIRISNTAYSISGATLTYVPANNGGYALTVSDRIQFDYFY